MEQLSDKEKENLSRKPIYRLLGESGLVEDEEGNVYSASEVLDEDETNPEYWNFYYDARYCGSSREAYVERMVRQSRSRRELVQDRERANTGEIPESIRRVADRNQQEAVQEGLRTRLRQYSSGVLYGLINRKGETVVEYGKYSVIGAFHNGLARVVDRKTGKFGFINPKGNEIIPCVWKSTGEFSEYLAGVKGDNNKCGYVDVAGQLVIPQTWDESWPFQEGLARVMDNGMIGMIDRRGELVIPCVWRGMGDIGEGLIGVQNTDGKCGYIDKTGKTIIPCQWKNVWAFSEGRAVVQDFNNRLGYIDKSGTLIIPCQWKKVEFFKNGRARVLVKKHFFRKDEWVYIDKLGRVIDDANERKFQQKHLVGTKRENLEQNSAPSDLKSKKNIYIREQNTQLSMQNIVPWYELMENGPLYNSAHSATHNESAQPETPVTETREEEKPSLATILAQSRFSLTRVMMEITVNLRTRLGKRDGRLIPISSWELPVNQWMARFQQSDIEDVQYLTDRIDNNILPSGVHAAVVVKFISGQVICYVATLNEQEEFRIDEQFLSDVTQLPVFSDNRAQFLDALQSITTFAYQCAYRWWGDYFSRAAACLDETIPLQPDNNVPPIPEHFARYIYADKMSMMGGGIGSWFDLPNARDEDFIRLSKELGRQQTLATLYAINNC